MASGQFRKATKRAAPRRRPLKTRAVEREINDGAFARGVRRGFRQPEAPGGNNVRSREVRGARRLRGSAIGAAGNRPPRRPPGRARRPAVAVAHADLLALAAGARRLRRGCRREQGSRCRCREQCQQQNGDTLPRRRGGVSLAGPEKGGNAREKIHGSPYTNTPPPAQGGRRLPKENGWLKSRGRSLEGVGGWRQRQAGEGLRLPARRSDSRHRGP